MDLLIWLLLTHPLALLVLLAILVGYFVVGGIVGAMLGKW